jgi:hypothetical protein
MLKMSNRSANKTALGIVGFLILCLASTAFAKDLGWPREKSNAGGTLIYYQPQLDEWKDFKRLEARMAISIKPIGGQPTLGVVTFRARTDADLETRNVVVSRLEIISVRFPSLDDKAADALEALVRKFLPANGTLNIDLDRLLAELDASKSGATPVVAVKNDPPVIFVAYEKSLLLLVDGDLVRAPIANAQLEFVVNSNWNVFFDPTTSKYYLLNERQWLIADDLAGPWKATTQLPKGMAKLPDQPNWADVKKAVPAPSGASRIAPKVFYSNKPAEIINFSGPPKFVNIQGTHLAYASNTESDLFLHDRDHQYYFLVAGRWFSAQSLEGPWSYATANLPADFALIPPNSEKGDVLASVPGTDEANDAVLLAQVPNTVIVNPTQAQANIKVAYDGAPQFKPIESTQLSYAVNTQEKVIKVGDLYYLCFQGVWFMSTGAQGPWTTAPSVPREIYTIPASSPVYNVTYVTQYTTSTGEIEASTTAGYFGAFIVGVTVGAIVSHGSGYYYPPYYYYGPYLYPIYRPYPITYGVGAYYNPHNGAYGYARGAYGPYGGVAGAAWYNPSTGTSGRAVGGCGVYGCAGAARAYNPYTGAYGATRQGSNAYSQWGSSVVTRGDQWAQGAHYSDARGTIAGARNSEGGRVVAGSGRNGSGFVGQSGAGDVYAGRDGNVYKKTDSGWQQYGNGGWNNPGSPTPHASSPQATKLPAASNRVTPAQNMRTPQSGLSATTLPAQRAQGAAAPTQQSQLKDLDRDAQARQTGNQRAQNFQRGGQGTRAAPSGRARRR